MTMRDYLSNYAITENGALAYKTTLNSVLDLFAMGASMRNRHEEDIIELFSDAYSVDPTLAMKVLFYIRDVRGGQGERRFFSICTKWLAENHPEAILRNFQFIPELGRWDDFYSFIDTPLQQEALNYLKGQLEKDLKEETPSLLGKWLKSENAAAIDTKELARITRKHLKMSSKDYRRMLTYLRKKINILEAQMSQGRWNEIQFDKIPSKAGFNYRKAFMRRPETAKRYVDFILDEKRNVNAKTLYPYEVIKRALTQDAKHDKIERAAINKYWKNLANYFRHASLDALCVIDTSGSMRGRPMEVAISLGLYCAEKNHGPWKDSFISFSSRPQFIEIKGEDIVDKANYIAAQNLIENTNIEAVFDLILNTAIKHKLSQKDIPQTVIIISDMEFDDATCNHSYGETTIEAVKRRWSEAGFELPRLVFWNVDARQNNIPILGEENSFVSGFSPSIFETIMSDKNGYELMLETVNKDRYSGISVSPKCP